MIKKLLFLTFLIIGVLSTVSSVSAACSIWRYRSDVETVRVNETMSGDDAPVIAIGWSRDHTEDMSFYVELDGAEWTYNDRGVLQEGVTYDKLNDTTLELIVDVGTEEGEIKFNAGKNIYLPINCKVTDAGEIRVIVDGNETTVSNANILIAKAIDGSLTVHGNKTAINQSGKLKKITITDSSTQSYKANQKFTLTLDTGFKFTGDITLTGTGKFDGLVKFNVDSGNSSKAYITITGQTPETKGEIIMEGIGVTRNSSGKFSTVLLNTTFTASMVPLNSKLSVASYDPEAESKETTTESTTETTTKATTTETTTEVTTSSVIMIQIGAASYTIDNRLYPLEVPAYISEGYSMLPLRALANAMGITDDNIQYNAQTKTATLTSASGTSVSITAGQSSISIFSGGLTVDMPISGTAEITNGRLFLPLRAMANALGVPDSNISYDAVTKTVTIQK